MNQSELMEMKGALLELGKSPMGSATAVTLAKNIKAVNKALKVNAELVEALYPMFCEMQDETKPKTHPDGRIVFKEGEEPNFMAAVQKLYEESREVELKTISFKKIQSLALRPDVVAVLMDRIIVDFDAPEVDKE